LLEDRSVVWNARPENRQLPSLLQWLQIRCLTLKKNWTPPQQKMMRKAARYHAVWKMLIPTILILLALFGWEGFGQLEGRRLLDRVIQARTSDVPWIIAENASYRRWLNPLLQKVYAQAEKDNDRRKQANVGIALVVLGQGEKYRLTTLAPLDAGRIVEILVKETDPVKEGQVLLRLEDGPARQRVKEAESALSSARTLLAQSEDGAQRTVTEIAKQELANGLLKDRYEVAGQELERLNALAPGMVSQQQLVAARLQVQDNLVLYKNGRLKLDQLQKTYNSVTRRERENARTLVTMMESRVKQACDDLEECKLKAPQAGTVLRILAGPGEIVGGSERQPVILLACDNMGLDRVKVEPESR